MTYSHQKKSHLAVVSQWSDAEKQSLENELHDLVHLRTMQLHDRYYGWILWSLLLE